MTPYQAYTLWDAIFGSEPVGGASYLPRNTEAQIAYAAVFSEHVYWNLCELIYADKDRVMKMQSERHKTAARLREWADAMEQDPT